MIRRRNRRRRTGPRQHDLHYPIMELLEVRQLLATDVAQQIPTAITSDPIHGVSLSFTSPLQGNSARDSSNYRLTFLGNDGLAGTGDDQVMPVWPEYADGSTEVQLHTVTDLSTWSEIDYGFPNGILGDWQIAADGSVTQSLNGGATFFVSDAETGIGEFRAIVEVDNDDQDFVGVVFGMERHPSTGLPDNYYLFSWNGGTRGSNGRGMQLARVSGTGLRLDRPDLWTLDPTDPHIEMIATEQAESWTAATPYEVRVSQDLDSLTLNVRDTTRDHELWSVSVPSTDGLGHIGLYNFSQPGARYWNVNTQTPLAIGKYELQVSPTDALRDSNGERLDGDGDGAAGGVYLGTFEIVDAAGPTVVSINPDAITNSLPADITIQFTEPLVADDARSPLVYRLAHLGADRELGGGDDLSIDLLPHYVVGSTEVTLSPSEPLVEGDYHLSATSGDPGLRDLDGIGLDGDRDGVPGGNLEYRFTVDVTPPQWAGLTLESDRVTIRLNEPFGLDVDTVTSPERYMIESTGGDGLFENGNDIVYDTVSLAADITWDESARTVTINLTERLPDERYRLRVSTEGIIDLAGNAMADDTEEVIVDLVTAAASIAIDLPAQHDSGSSSRDNLTNVASPSFAIQPNKPGLVEIFQDGATEPVLEQLISDRAALTYIPERLSDGEHTFTARLTSATGEQAERSLTMTVDTLGPALLPGIDSANAPLDNWTLSFSEVIQGFGDGATIDFFGPDESPIESLAIQTGARKDYHVTFPPLFEAGEYRFETNELVRDVAGNLIDQDRDGIVGELGDDIGIDTFRLLVDSDAPVVTAFEPTAPRREPIDLLQVTFSEAIDIATLTADAVTIVLPDGTETQPATRIVATGDAMFEIVITPLALEGTYTFRLADSITDVSGNRLADTYTTSVTIDLTGPNVVDVVASGSDSTSVDRLFVTFDTPVDLTSFQPSDVVLTGPDGSIDVTSVRRTAAGSYRVDFPVQTVQGRYDVEIGPNLLDALGNRMATSYATSFALTFADLAVAIPQNHPNFGLPSRLAFNREVTTYFDVLNEGQRTAAGTWRDRIWLSRDETLTTDGEQRDLLLYEGETLLSPLTAGQSYRGGTTFDVPLRNDLPEGDYYFFFETGVRRGFEDGQPTNNTARSALVSLFYAQLPDLAATTVVGPATTQPGQSLEVDWTVVNSGEAAAIGTWTDLIYAVSIDDGEQRLLGSSRRSSGLAPGNQYDASIEIVWPALPDRSYALLVVVDANDAVFEGDDIASNWVMSLDPITSRHPDLVPTIDSAPLRVASGEAVSVSWTTTNAGLGDARSGWIEHIYLSDNNVLIDRLIGTVVHDERLASGASRQQHLNVVVPPDLSGEYEWKIVTDAEDAIVELQDESNNLAIQPVSVTLTPPADLTATALAAFNPEGNALSPELPLIGDPASITVEWTVANQGDGSGVSDEWDDVIVVSVDDVIGNRDDIEIGRLTHVGGLSPGATYSARDSFLLPPEFTGRFRLGLITDATDRVHEGEDLGDNQFLGPSVEIMPIPYADLVVDSITAPDSIGTGEPLLLQWEVVNRGIGLTNHNSWFDRVWLTSDPSTFDPDSRDELPMGKFDHFGPISPGNGYSRIATLAIPETLATGTYYAVVETGGPFEFLHTDNNRSFSTPIAVVPNDAPDLATTEVVAPPLAQEGAIVDVTWTVENRGPAEADGLWRDQVFLRRSDDSSSDIILVGTYAYDAGLAPGRSYTRTEAITLPVETNGLFDLFVTTNFDASLFEEDTTSTSQIGANNTLASSRPVEVAVKPRPDLQVLDYTVPDMVDAGGRLAVEFSVVNQGIVGTTIPRWRDGVYLSLDTTISRDDIVMGVLGNKSALEPFGDPSARDRYAQETRSVVVPERYRGEVFVLIMPDVDDDIEEWPNERNNLTIVPVFVNPLPFADLVVSDVISPTLAVDGATIDLHYTVTNRGPGETNVTTWQEQIWLAQDRNRPHPARGDIHLTTRTHIGRLEPGAGYDVTVPVTIPNRLDSGIYYIIPWTDPLDQVLEDSLALHTNPDDPNEIDNSNFKAARIEVIGVLPDLVVTNLTTDQLTYMGRDTITVNWTVENQSPGTAVPPGWIDRVYISDRPNPLEKGARSLMIGEVVRSRELAAGASYDASIMTTLVPTAAGSYIVVVTDDAQPEGAESYHWIREVREDNNQRLSEIPVRPTPADLLVTDVRVEGDTLSGEPVTFYYTVTNVGEYSVWEHTEYWTDFLWLSGDPDFIRTRASYLGKVVTAHGNTARNGREIAPGESYEVAFDATLPPGASGDYYLTIDLDAHNDLSCLFYPLQCRLLLTDWWPADSGTNAQWLQDYRKWAVEDPTNNRGVFQFPITYYEPDLQVSDIAFAEPVTSGSTIPISYTVSNLGTRATRQSTWTDRVFLSRDPSLDEKDVELASSVRARVLSIGESYERTLDVRIPDSIEGTLYLLVYADSAAERSPYKPSDIGFGLRGLEIERNQPLGIFDLASVNQRSVGRGRVPEYQDEGNNIGVRTMPITLASPPDLQVSEVVAPSRVVSGQPFTLEYEVTNMGGPTASTQRDWDDLVYLSRDPFLDLHADRYLKPERFDRNKPSRGLDAHGSYRGTVSVRIPPDLEGPYYLFVVTDPVLSGDIGKVFEGTRERNNARAFGPLSIDRPPPSDLEVDAISAPDVATAGEPITVSWTVRNLSANAAAGSWSDTVFLSQDATWDLGDIALGRQTYSGTLAEGEAYTQVLEATMPAVVPGGYRIIVRTDIFNEVYEDVDDANNATASVDPLTVRVDQLTLGIPWQTTLSAGQTRLFQVSVAEPNRTFRATLRSSSNRAVNELFVRYQSAPTSAAFDATYQGGLADEQIAIVPSTEPGIYYLMVRGHSAPRPDTPATLLVELLPLTIDKIHTDIGSNSKYVTTTIEGAEFHADAIVKLIRPGFAEFEPVIYRVVDKTKIIATFDLSDAPKGLYDVKVINPDAEATAPYRFQVARRIEPEVTIGIGGPRAILAGDIGTYSVGLWNTGTVDAPYTFFQIGIPEMGLNDWVYNLPYVHSNNNIAGAPIGQSAGAGPLASLRNTVNTDGYDLTSGYAIDLDARGFTGFTFNVETYPGLRELHDRAFESLKERLYGAFPEYEELGILDDGPAGLDRIMPGLSIIWNFFGAIPDPITTQFIPFDFSIVAASTSMTRDEFIAHVIEELEPVRAAIVNDDEAPAPLVALAADKPMWNDLYLTALVDGGILRPDDQPPPIEDRTYLVGLMTTLASGLALGPAGQQLDEGELLGLFNHLRAWYGHTPDLEAPRERDIRPTHLNWIPEIPRYEDYDLGLSLPTQFESFRVYVPWIPFEERGAGLPPEFQIGGFDLGGIVLREEQRVSFSDFAGDTIFVQATIPDDLRIETLQYDQLSVGPLSVLLQSRDGNLDATFDFTAEFGFNLHVTSHVDLSTRIVQWAIKAIDATTGAPAANAFTDFGNGRGSLTYTLAPIDGVIPLDLSSYLEGAGAVSGAASLVGPYTADTNGMVPSDTPLPYTINFQNDPVASSHVNEIRIVTPLDESLDARSFRLGDMRIGNIEIDIPDGRGVFQGDFDFTESLGFVVRVSAGVDLVAEEATWLIEAIDPLTGELRRDPSLGLLPPNNAIGDGSGFVSYTIALEDDLASGEEISASARVIFDTAPPADTPLLAVQADTVAPESQLSVKDLGNANYEVTWQAVDDALGSGVRHVSVYYAADGGDFSIWQRQIEGEAGSAIFSGATGISYEFLTLATDIAGNRESPPFGTSAEDDGSYVNLGAPPTVPETTPPNFGRPPAATNEPTTNPIFLSAESEIPSGPALTTPTEFGSLVRPFTGRAFALGLSTSGAGIGPLAIAESPDQTILVSGGAARNQLFALDLVATHDLSDTTQTPALNELPYPIYQLAFDSSGNLWATTGGGPLLQLDPTTGEILAEHGDGLTMALAADRLDGSLYVSSSQGVERFDPATQQFTHFSRDENLRVGSLAFDNNGNLWGTTWPDRRQVVRFTNRARAETIFEFDLPVDSIAFGQADSPLAGLLVVSHNDGVVLDGASRGKLTLVDTHTGRHVTIADQGTRGDVVITTSDGHILVSQSHQVDILSPALAPRVVATNPPADGVVSLPYSPITVTFDQPMFLGTGSEPSSAINVANYQLHHADFGPTEFVDVVYVESTNTVVLQAAGLQPGKYELVVSSDVASASDLSLGVPYHASFLATSDFTAQVDIDFRLSRSTTDTMSFDVRITNQSEYSFQPPMTLLLDLPDGRGSVRGVEQDEGGRWQVDVTPYVASQDGLAAGASSEWFTITLDTPTPHRTDVETAFWTLPTANVAPIVSSLPVTFASVDLPYRYQIAASDPDGTSLAYLLISGPPGMEIDPQEGFVTWLPTDESPATSTVQISVFDTRGGADRPSIHP